MERELTPVGLRLRTVGQVGLAHGPDGRYYILRATKVETRVPPWTEELKQRVKNMIVHEQEEAILARLEQQLRTAARISVNRQRLYQIQLTNERDPNE